jgi:hypothetical protein
MLVTNSAPGCLPHLAKLNENLQHLIILGGVGHCFTWHVRVPSSVAVAITDVFRKKMELMFQINS